MSSGTVHKCFPFVGKRNALVFRIRLLTAIVLGTGYNGRFLMSP